MRNPAIPRPWLFAFSVAVALTGCTSLDAKTGAGGAAPGSIEVEVGYDSERPVELRVPVPSMNADMAQAMKEIEARRRGRSSDARAACPPTQSRSCRYRGHPGA